MVRDTAHYLNISIHTPARGVTMAKPTSTMAGAMISIHTPARGVTNLPLSDNLTIQISIHTPARGVTLHNSIATILDNIFQSTLPQGE